jgi:uncharacterized membrane protein YvbJ
MLWLPRKGIIIVTSRYNREIMFCQKCGAENKNESTFCNSCGADLRLTPDPVIKNKHNEIISAKIATKRLEINNITLMGPALVCIIGIVFCLLLFGITGVIIGGILIFLSFWWGLKRDDEKRKLKSQIKELEAELE